MRRRRRELTPALFLPSYGGGAVPGPWYLDGGVDAANCIAAYQPIGAADIATSYVNLANPGTYNASAPTAAPSFDTADGWTFNGSTQYLTTGITPGNTAGAWSMIVRFSDVAAGTGKYLCGALSSATTRFYIAANRGGTNVGYRNGNDTYLDVEPNLASGVLAVAGTKAYRNGNQETGTMEGWSGSLSHALFMGAYNLAGSAGGFLPGKIQALAIYNTTLTPAQVAAITARMAVLPL